MMLLNIAACVTFMTLVSSNPVPPPELDDLQSDLGKVKEVRALLENLLERKTKEARLSRQVGEVVERVFFSRSHADGHNDDNDDNTGPQSRAWTRPKEGVCQNGEKYTCKDNLCEHGKCHALCDAFPLGPNRERYDCRCDPGVHGLYCNVTVDPCKKRCYKPDHCYTMNASLSGYFCYSPDWKKLRNPEDIRERSVSEVEEMGRFAEVVDTIMRRQMTD